MFFTAMNKLELNFKKPKKCVFFLMSFDVFAAIDKIWTQFQKELFGEISTFYY
jgi:hypothetical protein